MLFRADEDLHRDRFAPAALICSVLGNLHRDEDRKPEPFTPADFMPGAVVKSEREQLIEWAEAVARGDTFDEPDEEEIIECRRRMQGAFSNVQ